MMRILSFDVGLRHLAFAELEATTTPAPGKEEEETSYSLTRWDVLDVTMGAGLPRGTNAIGSITDMLLDVLDRHFNDASHTYDTVLIENQPANKNPLMKSVQMIIYTFFQCLKMYVGNVGDVRLVSATRKLNLKHTNAVNVPANAVDAVDAVAAVADAVAAVDATRVKRQTTQTQREGYKARKDAAVRLASHYLLNILHDPARNASLMASKKKDDLSDCLLQALWFAESAQPRKS